MNIRSITTLFSDTFAFYKAHWEILLGIAVIPTLFQVALAYFNVESRTTPEVSIMIAGLLLAIAAAVFSILSAVALVRAIADPARYSGPLEAYKDAKGLFFSTFWVGLLSALVVVGGFILLIIPGIIFMVWYGFSYFTLVLDGKRGWGALTASKALVTGRWSAVFARFLVMFIAILAVAFAVEVILGQIMVSEMLRNMISSLIATIYTPFAFIYMYFMYKDLKAAPIDTSVPTPPAEPIPVAQPPVAPQTT